MKILITLTLVVFSFVTQNNIVSSSFAASNNNHQSENNLVFLMKHHFSEIVATRISKNKDMMNQLRNLTGNQSFSWTTYRGLGIGPGKYDPTRLSGPNAGVSDSFEKVWTTINLNSAVDFAARELDVKQDQYFTIIKFNIPNGFLKPLEDDSLGESFSISRNLMPDDRMFIESIGYVNYREYLSLVTSGIEITKEEHNNIINQCIHWESNLEKK